MWDHYPDTKSITNRKHFDVNESKYACRLCVFRSNTDRFWQKHLESAIHKRRSVVHVHVCMRSGCTKWATSGDMMMNHRLRCDGYAESMDSDDLPVLPGAPVRHASNEEIQTAAAEFERRCASEPLVPMEIYEESHPKTILYLPMERYVVLQMHHVTLLFPEKEVSGPHVEATCRTYWKNEPQYHVSADAFEEALRTYESQDKPVPVPIEGVPYAYVYDKVPRNRYFHSETRAAWKRTKAKFERPA